MQTMGIDLGTTNSCVAVFRNGKSEVIKNEIGSPTTPSVVAFTKEGRLVGEPARKHQYLDPKNTVYDTKRLIGRKFSEKQIQEDVKSWPFTIIPGPDDIPKIQVTENGKVADFFPEQISAMILHSLAQSANKASRTPITKAVITVPAYFNNAQRECTRNAAKIAGLEVLSIINEPTAAAIAYGFQEQTKEQTILVFDLGGGTLDVTILRVEDKISRVNGREKKEKDFRVLSTYGDIHFGGEDFDQVLLGHVLNELKSEKRLDLSTDEKAKQIIRRSCEETKKKLSQCDRADIQFTIDGHEHSISISKEDFEVKCDSLFERWIDVVNNAIAKSGLNENDIDNIILVGGSTRIPVIRSGISEFFGGKKPFFGLNPDEAVAQGAAILAAKLNSSPDTENGFIELVNIQDIVPRPIGISLKDDVFGKIIPENSHIPGEWTERYVTAEDDQTGVLIKILEGDDPKASNNHLIDTYHVNGIPKGKAGSQSANVKCKIDSSGILTVTTVILANGISKSLKIDPSRYQHSAEDIAHMRADHEKYVKYQDDIHRASRSLEDIDQYILKKIEENHSPSKSKKLKELREEIREWTENNRNIPISEILAKFEWMKSRIASI